jgi:hypothetical protein
VDSPFEFLSTAQTEVLTDVLSRRNPQLAERITQVSAVTQSDADEIVAALGNELTNNLDEDWEPTDYGREVSGVLARFNAARINEWP